ncbi:DUF4886 domain-containing protein [Chloroflexota bacterium]
MKNRQSLQRVVCIGLVVLFLAGCRGTDVKPTATFTPAPPITPQWRDTTLRILFIGNSYTNYHESLPQMFANLAQSGGHEVEVDVSAPGGWSLTRHIEARRTLSKIDAQWDLVVLQESGSIASVASKCKKQMYPAVHTLNERISATGAHIVFFMQWGCRDGTYNCDKRDFDEMQAQLHSCYMDIANELNAMVAPVGIAWQTAVTQAPQLGLWRIDGLHSSESGNYLAACVFYAVVYHQSPEGLTYPAGLTEETAHFLQAIAAETVLENPDRWNIP